MLEQMSAWEIAKWAALVFAAGFIGFFGKSLGRALLALFQKKEAAPPETQGAPKDAVSPGQGLPPAVESGRDPRASLSKDEQKLRKKAMKAEAKARKKMDQK
jgi:hypothetical protein